MKQNMRFPFQLARLIKDYPLACLLIAAVWYLSFFTPPKTQLDDISFIDKWVHVAMYGGTCSVMWAERVFRHRRTALRARQIVLGWLAPLAMSGLIELLQAYCTNGRRSGDWADFAANALGVTLALAIGWAFARLRPTR